MSEELNEIATDGAETLERLLRRAFEAGRLAGQREAAQALRSQLATVLNLNAIEEPRRIIASDPIETKARAAQTPEISGRASPGSVKPIIAEIVEKSPGLTTKEIQKHTGIKHNSVRGTLWTLTTEKIVERRGSQWYPVVKANEAAVASPKEASLAVSSELPLADDSLTVASDKNP